MYITLEKKRLVFGCFLESKENVAKSQCNRFDGGVLKNLKLISIFALPFAYLLTFQRNDIYTKTITGMV